MNYSFDWIARLKLKNIDDLKKIKKPVYYEIRPSSKCNAMCRMCNSNYSHLIEKENETINDKEFFSLIEKTPAFKINSTFDRVDVDSIKRIYVAGGDPSVMTSVYRFMEKCIKQKKTDFTFKHDVKLYFVCFHNS